MQPTVSGVEKTWKLPPLILHPFSDASGPGKLVESSRASLMLQGLLPSGELSREELDRRLLNGRYCEIRMLFYVGRDIARWIEQCEEFVQHHAELQSAGIQFGSFATLLVDDPPAPAREKLKRWGVADYRHIFSRALGLNAIFAEVPSQDALATEFIRFYYRYADQMYTCKMKAHPFAELRSANFDFDLYASGEYSRLLEKEWGSDADSGVVSDQDDDSR